MKVLFMGTPDFAAGILKSIIEAGHEVVLAVTQCDKPKGRGKTMQFTPVKEMALQHNIEVYQPARIKNAECIEELKKYPADITIVAAYGQILPKEILEMSPLGCVNVHASLLPKYRGAAPIQWSIIDGETETGVTTMMMDVGLDTGDMIDKAVVPISADETGGSLHDKLMEAGAKLILETMEKLQNKTAIFTKQKDEESCYAKMLTKTLGNIDFTMPAVQIERLIRGLNPWPSAYTSYKGKNLKIWQAAVVTEDEMERVASSEDVKSAAVSQIVYVCKDSFFVKTGEGYLEILELQLEGKKRMQTRAFLQGVNVVVGEKLSEI